MWVLDIYHMNWLQRMLWRMAMRVINWLHRNNYDSLLAESGICLSQCSLVNTCLSEREVSDDAKRKHDGKIIDTIGRDEYRIEKEDLGFYYEMWLTTKDRIIRPPRVPKTGIIYELMSRTLTHEKQVQLFQFANWSFHNFWFEKIKMIPCTIKSETAIPKWLTWFLPAQLHLYFFVNRCDAETILSGRRWSIPHKCSYLVEHMILSSNG